MQFCVALPHSTDIQPAVRYWTHLSALTYVYLQCPATTTEEIDELLCSFLATTEQGRNAPNKYRLVGRSAWPRCLAYQMQPIQSVTQCITRMSPQLLKRHIGQNLFPAENILKNMHVPRLPPSLPLLWWYLYAFYVTLGSCIDYFVPRRASPNLINAVPLQNGNYVLRHSFPLECQTGHRPACSSG